MVRSVKRAYLLAATTVPALTPLPIGVVERW